MRLATINLNGTEQAGIVTGTGIIPAEAANNSIGTSWKTDLFDLIDSGQLREMTDWYNAGGNALLEEIPGCISFEEVVYAPLYRNPRRIFCIGLNYTEHAADISSSCPHEFPGSYFKAPDTLIGYHDDILIPSFKGAEKTTAEAELGIILGKSCRDIDKENWLDAVAGFTTILDMTEESILKGTDERAGNPRYLTIAKNFPTFFSFGPQLVTPDEITDINKLEVQSVLNGKTYAYNTVSHMTHLPPELVSLHSSIMGWCAGDVLSTGTPRAFEIHDGDIAECRIFGPDGFSMEPLLNPVIDLKKQ